MILDGWFLFILCSINFFQAVCLLQTWTWSLKSFWTIDKRSLKHSQKKLKCLVMLESSTNYEFFRVLRLCLNIVLANTALDSQAHILSSWIAKSSLSSKIYRQKKVQSRVGCVGQLKLEQSKTERECFFIFSFSHSVRCTF